MPAKRKMPTKGRLTNLAGAKREQITHSYNSAFFIKLAVGGCYGGFASLDGPFYELFPSDRVLK